VRGSPIRKSSDQRSVDSSPRLIAASYVLHRLLVPRHPPCALNNLATQKTPPHHPRKEALRRAYTNPEQTESEDARVHCAVLNVRPVAPHPSPPAHTLRREVTVREQESPDGDHGPGHRPGMPALSGPNSVPTTGSPHPPRSPRHRGDAVLGAAAAAGRTGQRSTLEHHPTRSARHPRRAPDHGVGAALHQRVPQRSCVGECSLERR
jgi:hypothetical protein